MKTTVRNPAQYKRVTLLIGEVRREAGWEGLLEDIEVAAAGGVVHAACELDELGRDGSWRFHREGIWSVAA